MILRTRILLGYWYLALLVVVGAAAAALGFHALGSSIGTVLKENFESVQASMQMLDALERQDSAVLALLLGDSAYRAQLQQSELDFRTALRRAGSNVTIEAEQPILEDIETRYDEYTAARDSLLETRHERPLAAYEATTFPLFDTLKVQVYSLLDVNHQAMVQADRRAQRSARQRAMGYGLLVAVALLSLVVLSEALGRHVLSRLSELRSVAQAIAEGDRSRRAATTSRDELGLVGQQLNAVLDCLRETEGNLEGRLQQQRQMVLALLDQLPWRAALLSLRGAVVASTLSDAETVGLERAVAGDAALDPEQAAGPRPLNVGGVQLLLKLMRAGGVRPVGWLAVKGATD
jgi:methyl-accepting chemotaxis protein